MFKISKTKTIYLFLSILFFEIFGLVKESQAADWFVSQNGSGSKDGTSLVNAWKASDASSASSLCSSTGCVAWNNMAAGDTLYIVGALTNLITFPVGTSGSINDYFTIKGYDNNSGVALGTRFGDTGWAGPDEFGAYNRTYTATVTNMIEWTSTPLAYINLTNRNKAPDGDWRNGDYWYDCPDLDCASGGSKIYYKPSDGILTGKNVTVGATLGITVDGHDWVKIENLKLIQNRIRVGHSVASQYVWLDSLTIADVPATGISVENASNNGRISHCSISGVHNGVYLIGSGNKDWQIDHNKIDNVTETNEFHTRGDAHGIGIQGGNRIIMENNDISRANTGITMWTGTSLPMNENIVRYNHIHNMEGNRGDGRAEGIGWEGTNTDPGSMTGNYIYNNIVHNCVSTGSYIENGGGIRIKFINPGNYIYNNTVRDCDPNYYFQGVSASFPIGAVIKNNISLYPKSNHWGISAYNNGDYSRLTFSNNLYYPDDGARFKFKGTNTNFTNWKTALRNSGADEAEADSFASDPLLINTSGSYSQAADFLPQPASPAINAGTDVGLTTDFDGHPIFGAPDIGAYEYQNGSDTTSPSAPSGLSAL